MSEPLRDMVPHVEGNPQCCKGVRETPTLARLQEGTMLQEGTGRLRSLHGCRFAPAESETSIFAVHTQVHPEWLDAGPVTNTVGVPITSTR